MSSTTRNNKVNELVDPFFFTSKYASALKISHVQFILNLIKIIKSYVSCYIRQLGATKPTPSYFIIINHALRSGGVVVKSIAATQLIDCRL